MVEIWSKSIACQGRQMSILEIALCHSHQDPSSRLCLSRSFMENGAQGLHYTISVCSRDLDPDPRILILTLPDTLTKPTMCTAEHAPLLGSPWGSSHRSTLGKGCLEYDGPSSSTAWHSTVCWPSYPIEFSTFQGNFCRWVSLTSQPQLQ